MDSKSVNANSRDAEISGTNATSEANVTSETKASFEKEASSEEKASASANENRDTTYGHTKPMSFAAKLKYIDGIEFLDEDNPKYLLPVGKGDEANRWV